MRLQKLHIGHYNRLKPFFEQQPFKLSIYSLPSIMAWRNAEDLVLEFVVDRGRLLMAARDAKGDGNGHAVIPIPPLDVKPPELADLLVELGEERYRFVPEQMLENFHIEEWTKYFHVREEKGFEDYVYLTEDLAYLKGRKYSKKRNLISQFERAHAVGSEVQVQAIGPDVTKECMEFLEEWCDERECDLAELPMFACEKEAARTALEEFGSTDLEGILVRFNGKVSGYAMAAPLQPDMGVLLFEKAFKSVKGLYQFLDRECARRLFLGKYEFINKECDLGLQGLKAMKRSYHPVMRVKSFELKLLG